MSWAYKAHRGKPSFHKQLKKVLNKPADPWLYMGDGEYVKYSEFKETFQKEKDNASKV